METARRPFALFAACFLACLAGSAAAQQTNEPTSEPTSEPTHEPMGPVTPHRPNVEGAPRLALPSGRVHPGPAKIVPAVSSAGGRDRGPQLPAGAVARIGGPPGVPGARLIAPDGGLFVAFDETGSVGFYRTETRERVATGALPANPIWGEQWTRLGFGEGGRSLVLWSSEVARDRIWVLDTSDGKVLREIRLPAPAEDIDVDPWGRRVVASFEGDWDRLVIVDLENGALVERRLPEGVAPPDSDDRVELEGVGLSRDGRLAAVGLSRGEAGRTSLVDLVSGAIRWRVEHRGSPRFSPTEKQVALLVDGEVTLLDAATGAFRFQRFGEFVVFTPEDHVIQHRLGVVSERNLAGERIMGFLGPENDYVRSGALTPDGRLVVATGMLPETYWWDRRTGQELLLPAARLHGVSLAFDATGDELVGNDGEYVHRWSARTGLPLDRRVVGTTLLADPLGQRLLASEGEAAIDAAVRAAEKATPLAESRTITLSRDGSHMMVETLGGSSPNVVLNRRTGAIRTLDGPVGLALSPDGTTMLDAEDGLRLRDVDTGKVVLELDAPEGEIHRALFAPDGKRIFAWGYEGAWMIAADGKSKPLALVVSKRVVAAVFRPDGKRLALGLEDGRIELRDAGGSRALRTLTGHLDSVFTLVFSADGRRLASASEDGTGLVWSP
ncbi:MAG: hypothetical protein KC731_02060 [Myxococcales bacterium]|nr:hypothetical protein [Myxococcales bacterium]